jgi:hypothetical protein
MRLERLRAWGKMMAEFIDMIDGYKIQKGSRDYIVSNVNGKYENHGHFQKLSTCYVMVRLIRKNTIPKSPYLIEAARRITIDPKYEETLTHKLKKLKRKQMYYNSNKEVRP